MWAIVIPQNSGLNAAIGILIYIFYSKWRVDVFVSFIFWPVSKACVAILGLLAVLHREMRSSRRVWPSGMMTRWRMLGSAPSTWPRLRQLSLSVWGCAVISFLFQVVYLFIHQVSFSDLHQNLIIFYWGHPQHVLQIWSKSITFWTNKQNIIFVCTI